MLRSGCVVADATRACAADRGSRPAKHSRVGPRPPRPSPCVPPTQPALLPPQKLVPTVVPGIVLGLLCTLGFLFFALWCCVQCCNRRKVKAAGSERAQFLAAGAPQVWWPPQSPGWGGLGLLQCTPCAGLLPGSTLAWHLWLKSLRTSPSTRAPRPQSSPYDPAPPPASWRQRRWAQPGFLYKALLVALALALAGTAAWGLAESVEATDTTFSHLWANVNDVERRVGGWRVHMGVGGWMDGRALELTAPRPHLVWW